ncbi:hypothetical protein, partial [Streptomyces cyaneofuscatus]|uniref:hypothetical protein n=1 Tax=Streptomyces cyaneofuscatus TaxID=66883 RepID=UPI0036AEA803
VPMAVLGALATPFNAPASVLFIYAAAGAGPARPGPPPPLLSPIAPAREGAAGSDGASTHLTGK